MTKTKITDNQIQECLKEGMKGSEIARKYNMTTAAVNSRIRKMKAKLNPAPDPRPAIEENIESNKKIKQAYESYGKKKAEELTEETHIDIEAFYRDLYKKEVEKLKKGIELLRKALSTGAWIPTKLMLPPEPTGQMETLNQYEEYLVTIAGSKKATSLYYIGEGEWRDNDSEEYHYYKVIAWAPIPQAYNEP